LHDPIPYTQHPHWIFPGPLKRTLTTLTSPVRRTTSIRQWTTKNQQDEFVPIPNDTVSLPPKIDPTKTIRIIAQNPQYALQLGYNNSDALSTIDNLISLQASVYAASSPNFNWHNSTNIATFKYPLQMAYQHLHLSAITSDMGKTTIYKNIEI